MQTADCTCVSSFIPWQLSCTSSAVRVLPQTANNTCVSSIVPGGQAGSLVLGSNFMRQYFAAFYAATAENSTPQIGEPRRGALGLACMSSIVLCLGGSGPGMVTHAHACVSCQPDMLRRMLQAWQRLQPALQSRAPQQALASTWQRP